MILKSLLVVGGRGGAIFIDENQWSAFKPSFRARVENYARHLAAGDLSQTCQALYLTPHLWSEPGVLWAELSRELGPRAQLVSQLDRAFSERQAKLLVVDPSMIMTREDILKLLAWSRSGRTLVMPMTTHFTESAKQELEQALAHTKKIQVNIGANYSIHALGEGKWVNYILSPAPQVSQLSDSSLSTFATAVLAVADIDETVSLSISKNAQTGFLTLAKREGGRGLFVMNGSSERVSVEIRLSETMKISDLSQALAHSTSGDSDAVEAERLTLDIPAFGILPLSLDPYVEKRAEADLPGIVTSQVQLDPASPERNVWN